ncbi:MAG: hypothetical protein ACREJ3_17935, partial [Polyangiaceae bacterium]
TGTDVEAPALALDLGITAYEARLLLAAGTPAIALSTADEGRAAQLLGKLRARGHGAVMCDAADVVSSASMVAMRRARIEEGSLHLDGPSGSPPGPALPFEDVVALIAAVHRRRTETSTSTTDRHFSAARAVLSGGVVLTKTVTMDARSVADDRERVLYLFRRSGATPWLLREHGTGWAGLSIPLAHSSSENFLRAIAALRERARGALYDERLLTRKATSEQVALSGANRAGGPAASGASQRSTVRTSSDGGVDLLAHLIALWARARNTPPRDASHAPR